MGIFQRICFLKISLGKSHETQSHSLARVFLKQEWKPQFSFSRGKMQLGSAIGMALYQRKSNAS